MSQILTNLRREAFKTKPYIDRLSSHELAKICIVPSRTKYYNNRHRDPRYRLERSRKIWKITLPNFDELRDDTDLSPDQIRAKLKEKGIAPPSVWNERELYSPCTITVMERYVPASEDEKSSSLTDKLKTPISSGKSLFKDWRQLSHIRTFEGEDFQLEEFARQSLEIYVKAYEALAAKDEKKIFDYVTEHCFPLMTAGINRHTIMWKYLGEIEPPQVVQTRAGDLLSKGNKFAQITVRMHTKQMLAIYDRHGRLIHGSPRDVKEVLEYIVFEKYLANEYGLWRIHDRIRPGEDALPFSQQVSKTYVKQAN